MHHLSSDDDKLDYMHAMHDQAWPMTCLSFMRIRNLSVLPCISGEYKQMWYHDVLQVEKDHMADLAHTWGPFFEWCQHITLQRHGAIGTSEATQETMLKNKTIVIWECINKVFLPVDKGRIVKEVFHLLIDPSNTLICPILICLR